MTDYMVIGKFRNIDKVRALIAGLRKKGKTCYDFTAKPADPTNPDASQGKGAIIGAYSQKEFFPHCE